MAKDTRHKRMVGEREKRIKDLKENIKGHEQLQELTYAYIALLLEKLGADGKENAAVIDRKALRDRVGDPGVMASINETGDILLYLKGGESDGEGTAEAD